MKRTIYNSLQKPANENKLILKSSKNNAIIDFVSCVPEMTEKPVTINNIIHGFVENGMIYFEILSKCRKDSAVEEYKLCETRFPYLLQKYMYDGHGDDAMFEDIGFPVDVD